MLIQCNLSPPLQHSDSTAIFIPNLKPRSKSNCPISCNFSIFQSNGTSLFYLSGKPKKNNFRVPKLSLQGLYMQFTHFLSTTCFNEHKCFSSRISSTCRVFIFSGSHFSQNQVLGKEGESKSSLTLTKVEDISWKLSVGEETRRLEGPFLFVSTILCSSISWWGPVQVAQASEIVRTNMVYEVGELFELGIQLSYLLLLLALLGVGSFYVIRQVLVRRELDLSAKELQEQVRSGDASATELFELGAVMLRRKFYPAATKYLRQAIEKWDGDDQDLAQVYNALGVTYVRDEKVEKGIAQFENAVKLQPGYVTAWNNLGDAYEKTKDLKSALRAFEEVLLFDPNNKIARPRRDALKQEVDMYRGVSVKSKKK